MTAPGASDPAVTWDSRQARCGECATVYDGPVCPGCGEHAGAEPLHMLGFVTTRDDGDWLVTVEANAEGMGHRERRLTGEHAAWLAR
jgi:hypothetical protein